MMVSAHQQNYLFVQEEPISPPPYYLTKMFAQSNGVLKISVAVMNYLFDQESNQNWKYPSPLLQHNLLPENLLKMLSLYPSPPLHPRHAQVAS
jgi:hypothetical protein